MLYLLLATLCSASIALIFKHSETKGMNRYAVTSANYLAACLAGAALVVSQGLSVPDGFTVSSAYDQLSESWNGGAASPTASLLWAVMVGTAAGLVFFLAFIYYQISVRTYGVGLAGTFAKLGILVPMSLSLVFWTELPTVVQWCGIALAVSSIALVNWPSTGKLWTTLKPALLLLFLFGGMSEFSNKVFQKYALQEYKAIFLLTTFTVALVFSLATALLKNRSVRWRDIVTGIAVGIPNLFSSFFLILGLGTIPATVAFPVYGAGTILIINLVGLAFFKEKMSGCEIAAVGMTIVALILINL